MQRFARELHWRKLTVGVGAFALVAAIAFWRQTPTTEAAGEAASKITAGKIKAGEDVTKSVELKTDEAPLRAGRDAYYVKAKVVNTSDKAIDGPLFLVIDGTGVDGMTVANADGELDDGASYFEIVKSDETLEPEKETKVQRVNFKSEDGRLNVVERRNYKLKYRVIRPEDVKNDRPNRLRRNIGPKTGSNSKSGSGGGGSKTNGPANAEDAPLEPEPDPVSKKPEPGVTDAKTKKVIEIQDRWNGRLMRTDGVTGVATGLSRDGKDVVIRVYTERAGIRDNLPVTAEGIKILPVITGQFRPLAGIPDKIGQAVQSTTPPRDFNRRPPLCFDRPDDIYSYPIPIGVGAIWIGDAGSTGTIGCRIRDIDTGEVYALSNNHVFAGERTLGITGPPPDIAEIGDPIIQPGNVTPPIAVAIGTLAAYVPFEIDNPCNKVDAALMRPEIVFGSFRSSPADGILMSDTSPCYGYGTPRSRNVQATLGMRVMKTGRTTFTRTAAVTAVNGVSTVGYDVGDITFCEQIIVTDDQPSVPFGGPGDSGSLVVSEFDCSGVGLLFAGGGGQIICNRIDVVLDELGRELGFLQGRPFARLTIDGTP